MGALVLRVSAWLPSLACALLCGGSPGLALAALGGDDTSIEADRVQLRASGRLIAASAYSMHEMQTSSGTTVREYVANGGVVFAVTWLGPFKPDLRQLLGGYFATFRDAPRDTTRHHSNNTQLVGPDGLIVQTGGRQRAFFGKAYVPKLVPAGVLIDELQ
jgi:hypothetical protein